MAKLKQFFIEQLHLLYFIMTRMDLIRKHLCLQLNNALCLLLEPFGRMEIGYPAPLRSGFYSYVPVQRRAPQSCQNPAKIIHAIEFLKRWK